MNKIRFIDSKYNTKFFINDGDSVRITRSDGESKVQKCKYIDEYHVQVGMFVYHICELAEKMESIGSKIETVK